VLLIEAHIVTLLTIYGFFLTEFWTEYPQEKLVVEEKVAEMIECFESRHLEDAAETQQSFTLR